MIQNIKILSIIALLSIILPISNTFAYWPLIKEGNLTYEWAFRVPKDELSSVQYSRLAYGWTNITYNPANNSLFIVWHPYGKMLTEISIPEIIKSNTFSSLKTASVIQSPIDITGWNINKLWKDWDSSVSDWVLWWFMVYNNKLIWSVYSYYDADWKAYRSHYTASLNWTRNGINFSGMYRVWENITNSWNTNWWYVWWYMTTIPTEWKDTLGWPAMTWLWWIAIISRSSYGPSVSVFDPDKLWTTDITPATMLIWYPSNHPTLWTYDWTSLYYNMSTQIRWIIFPEWTSSVLFFGAHWVWPSWLWDSCYGIWTSDKSLDWKINEQWVKYCYDPSDSSKWTHAYPYVYRIWAYDANDLVKVKNWVINPDTKETYKPWDIKPYAIWNLDLPFSPEKKEIIWATYDSNSKRLYISQFGWEHTWMEPYPIIHTYKLDINTSTSTSSTSSTSTNTTTTNNSSDKKAPTITNTTKPTILPMWMENIIIKLETNENATCKISKNQNTSYNSMSLQFSITWWKSHSQIFHSLSNWNTYKYYVKCSDAYGNSNSQDFVLNFGVEWTKKLSTIEKFFQEGRNKYPNNSNYVKYLKSIKSKISSLAKTKKISNTKLAPLLKLFDNEIKKYSN